MQEDEGAEGQVEANEGQVEEPSAASPTETPEQPKAKRKRGSRLRSWVGKAAFWR